LCDLAPPPILYEILEYVTAARDYTTRTVKLLQNPHTGEDEIRSSIWENLAETFKVRTRGGRSHWVYCFGLRTREIHGLGPLGKLRVEHKLIWNVSSSKLSHLSLQSILLLLFFDVQIRLPVVVCEHNYLIAT